jgi:imidazolonepropionase
MDRFLLSHARLATMQGGRYSIVEDGALLAENGRIAWIGPSNAPELARVPYEERIDAKGALVTPALVDCHTHLVYAGDRAREHEMRLQGATYAEIAAAGGGIASTVKATRAASDAELTAQSAKRLDAMLEEGVRTVEIKSGYGLDVANELRCLRIARSLEEGRPVTIRTTLLGAHAVPIEYKGHADDYVSLVCDEMIPAAAREGLADAVDAFCEGIGFTPVQTRRVFEAARAHRLPVKLHADQLTNLAGAKLAAEFGALSADHLEHTDVAGVAAMAQAKTVAVLLPGAYHFLRETRLPPVEALRRHGVRMAVATDSNPGTSPTTSLTLMISFACTLFGLTPEEALAGVTCHAAAALGLADRGVLEPGRRADFALWDLDDPAGLAYAISGKRPVRVGFSRRELH